MTSTHVNVELLLVPDCPNGPAARDLLRSALHGAGLPDAPIRVIVIDSQREAEHRRFVGSPTILINGVDPFAEPGRPAALACRVYSGPTGPSGLPPADQLQQAVTDATSPA